MSPIKLQTDCKNVCCMEKQSTALGSSCLGTVRIWGGGEVRGRIQNRRPREGVSFLSLGWGSVGATEGSEQGKSAISCV